MVILKILGLTILAVISLAPVLALGTKLRVRGIPIRKDYSNPTVREAFNEYIYDVKNTNKSISIVTGELDSRVYDRVETKSGKLCLYDELYNSLEKGVEISIYASDVITISDAKFTLDGGILRETRDKVVQRDPLNLEEMMLVSDLLKLVLQGVVNRNTSKPNKIKLFIQKPPAHRHFRISDYGEKRQILYVEEYHPALEPVKHFYKINKSIFLIRKYHKVLIKNIIPGATSCASVEDINKEFTFYPRSNYKDYLTNSSEA